MFKKGWDFVTNMGLQKTINTSGSKHIKLSNQLTALSILFTLCYIPVFLYWGFTRTITSQALAITVYSISLLLSHRGYFLSARMLYILGIFLHMFMLCLFFGEASQMHLLFIPVAAIPLILYDLSHVRIIITLVLAALVMYALLQFINFSSPFYIPVQDSTLRMMRFCFNVTAIVGEIIVIASFVYNFERSEKKLDHSNELLQVQLQAIFENSFDALFLVDWKKKKIIKVNQRAVELFGMSSEEEFYDQYGISLHKELPDEAEMYRMRSALETKGFYEGEVLYKKKDGSEFWGALAIKLVLIGSERYQSVRVTDITPEKQAKAQIESALQEKELLLSEIHHRVKNNMAVISGLLGLQSSYVEDEHSRLLFEESRNRIHSMALIHDKLYQHETLARIDFNAYCKDLLQHINSSYNSSATNIKCSITCNDVLIDIKNAVPCGLILNELISNAYKHAFKNRDEGEIRIICTKMGGKFTMMVSDNGVGYDAEALIGKPVSLGLTLVTALVEQVSGNIKTSNKNGTTYYISFEE
ncbi:MAG TPA: histidine kinase dimerization/phosphoacceptor domain -containing protein [Bacteroidia bacterium]|jgi:PAS domain S-box-containing protein